MEEGRHVNFTEFCPSTLSRASTKWHERLGKSDLVKILYVQLNNTKKNSKSGLVRNMFKTLEQT
jgi:hypothetical protein